MNLVCVHLVYAGLEGRTRNLSWGGRGFISFFSMGGEGANNPLGPENSLETIDFGEGLSPYKPLIIT